MLVEDGGKGKTVQQMSLEEFMEAYGGHLDCQGRCRRAVPLMVDDFKV